MDRIINAPVHRCRNIVDLSVRCQKCKAEIAIDIDIRCSPESDVKIKTMVVYCHTCGHIMEVAALE